MTDSSTSQNNFNISVPVENCYDVYSSFISTDHAGIDNVPDKCSSTFNQSNISNNDNDVFDINNHKHVVEEYKVNHDHFYCTPFESQIVKFYFLNVCGLVSKLLIPDFIDFVRDFDIFCIVETKLDKFDDINVEGYTFRSINRENCKRGSGGVGVFIKNSLIKNVLFLDPLKTVYGLNLKTNPAYLE